MSDLLVEQVRSNIKREVLKPAAQKSQLACFYHATLLKLQR